VGGGGGAGGAEKLLDGTEVFPLICPRKSIGSNHFIFVKKL